MSLSTLLCLTDTCKEDVLASIASLSYWVLPSLSPALWYKVSYEIP